MSKMKELSNALIQLEQVNLVVQQLIGKALGKELNPKKTHEKLETGWQIFERIVKESDSRNLQLKLLDVRNCGMDTDVIQQLKRALSKKVELIIDKKGRNYEDLTTSCCVCSR